MSKAPLIAGTMQTDPRSGGVKRSSGVNVLPIVTEGSWINHWGRQSVPYCRSCSACWSRLFFRVWKAWTEARDNANEEIDWVLIGYDGNSKTDLTLLEKGNGGIDVISGKLPPGVPVFGGVRTSKGRFVSFLYIDEDCSAMKRGRTLMYKNGTWQQNGDANPNSIWSYTCDFLFLSLFL